MRDAPQPFESGADCSLSLVILVHEPSPGQHPAQFSYQLSYQLSNQYKDQHCLSQIIQARFTVW